MDDNSAQLSSARPKCWRLWLARHRPDDTAHEHDISSELMMTSRYLSRALLLHNPAIGLARKIASLPWETCNFSSRTNIQPNTLGISLGSSQACSTHQLDKTTINHCIEYHACLADICPRPSIEPTGCLSMNSMRSNLDSMSNSTGSQLEKSPVG